MKEVEVNAQTIWEEDECLGMICPNCGNPNLIVGIYRDNPEQCKCGKKYVITQQKTFIYELIED